MMRGHWWCTIPNHRVVMLGLLERCEVFGPFGFSRTVKELITEFVARPCKLRLHLASVGVGADLDVDGELCGDGNIEGNENPNPEDGAEKSESAPERDTGEETSPRDSAGEFQTPLAANRTSSGLESPLVEELDDAGKFSESAVIETQNAKERALPITQPEGVKKPRKD